MYCGIPHRSILGPLLFLISVNNKPQAVKSTLLMYAFFIYFYTFTFIGTKGVDEIKKQLTEDFENICDWFVDNKLSINFGEDKTKSIILAFK